MARPRKKTDEEQAEVQAGDAEAVPAEEVDAVPGAAVDVVGEGGPAAEEPPGSVAVEAASEDPPVGEAPALEPDAAETPADEDESARVGAVTDSAADAPLDEEPVDEPTPVAEVKEDAAETERAGAVLAPPTDEPAIEEPAVEEAAPEALPAEAAASATPVPAEPAETPKREKRRSSLTRAQKREKRAARTRAPKTPGERRPIVRLPKPEHPRGQRKERRGVVVSSAMDKTIVVRVDTVKADRRYKKVVRHSRKFHAHDERNEANVGDLVRIVETRPLSKTKNWRLAEVVEAAR